MSLPGRKRSIRRRAQARRDLKDRLIQTRVPESLESTLKDEAKRQRLSVSHLIRNVLEDTFHLVDGVVAEVDNLVQDSVGLARQVRRDAARIAQSARNPARAADEKDTADADTPPPKKTAARSTLDDVLAWNPVVMNKPAPCSNCGQMIERGETGHLGVSMNAGAARFLCATCVRDI